jgi:hypothetical protein
LPLLLLLAAAASSAATASAGPTGAAAAVRLDCGTRVLALVFLPGKRLVDIGDASHRRLLVADRRHYVFRSTCRSTLGKPVLLRAVHASTTRTTRLGCVFPARVQLVVERGAAGLRVLAAERGSRAALVRVDLTRPRLDYDRGVCRVL